MGFNRYKYNIPKYKEGGLNFLQLTILSDKEDIPQQS